MSLGRFSHGLVVVALLFIHRWAQAAEESAALGSSGASAKRAAADMASANDPLAMASLWQLTLGMLLVLGLILGLAWLMKRSGRFQAAGGGLRIVGGLSLGARERVVLIQAGETQLLLGVAPGRVQTLHVLDQPLPAREPGAVGGFSEQLARVLNKGKSS